MKLTDFSGGQLQFFIQELECAKNLIESPQKWCRDAEAKFANGKACSCTAERAARFSLLGALGCDSAGRVPQPLLEALLATLAYLDPYAVPSPGVADVEDAIEAWHATVDHGAVVELCREAIRYMARMHL
jgi:hypothetical protein